MQPVDVWPPWSSWVCLLAVSLVLVGGALYYAICVRRRSLLWKRDLAAAQEKIQEQSTALTEAEREIGRLKRIPKAELLPMLQLAHELRSPLASIQNSLDMLLQGYAANNIDLQNELLSLARDRAETMLGRVNDFLRLGAIRHAEIERKITPVQLRDVLHRLVPEIRVRAKWRAVNVHLNVSESLPAVDGTYEDMEHLLSNLINNAIKYTNPGGHVTITLKENERGIVGIVEDTGIGIPQEDLGRIFDEFYRSETAKDMDAHGTGLGLAIAKRVADLYGGQLYVESELGKGSKFTFVFPKSPERREG